MNKEFSIYKSTTNSLGFINTGNPKGKSLVLIPGWGTDATFLYVIAKMLPSYNIFLVDLPGYGLSSSLKHLAANLDEQTNLLLKTIPGAFHLISWSQGSLIGINAATQNPQKIQSLITICGSPRFPCDPNWPGMSYNLILKCKHLLTPNRTRRLLKFFYKMQNIDIEQRFLEAKEILDIAELHKQWDIDYEVLMAGIDLISYADLRHCLKYLPVPSLHLFAKEDNFIPWTLAKYFPQDENHSNFIFEHSGHAPFLSEPVLFKKIITQFLSSH